MIRHIICRHSVVNVCVTVCVYVCVCLRMSCFKSVIRLCRLDDSFTDRFVDIITSCVGSLITPNLTEDVNSEMLFYYYDYKAIS